MVAEKTVMVLGRNYNVQVWETGNDLSTRTWTATLRKTDRIVVRGVVAASWWFAESNHTKAAAELIVQAKKLSEEHPASEKRTP